MASNEAINSSDAEVYHIFRHYEVHMYQIRLCDMFDKIFSLVLRLSKRMHFTFTLDN